MASDLTTGGSDANRGIIAELLGKGSQISQDISSMFLSTRMQGIVEPSSLLDDKKYLVSRHLAERRCESWNIANELNGYRWNALSNWLPRFRMNQKQPTR